MNNGIYPIKDIPHTLQHKPILACENTDPEESDDVKYLSLGLSQFDNETISLKVFRKTSADSKWARGEDIPPKRLLNLTILLLGGISNILRNDATGHSSLLHEQWVYEETKHLEVLKDWLVKEKSDLYKKIYELEKLIKTIYTNK
ncbi:MAG: DUF6530 family protein [Bacteroides sp.]|nr:DUF6530 family protein [Lachnospiraceae bacterium]MCM1333057.1 DUF6530 family protein [Bacteroides sp.]MCM1389315.1 DUF6530 family protein [Bacteroides sp.]